MTRIIILIIIALIFFLDELFSTLNLKRTLKNSGELLEKFEFKFKLIDADVLFLMVIMTMFFIFRNILNVFDIIYLTIFAGSFLIKIKSKNTKITIYQNGLLLKGYFIDWRKIDKIEVNEKKNIIVYSDVFSSDLIKVSGLYDAERLKEEIIKNMEKGKLKSEISFPDFSSQNMPVFSWICDVLIRTRK